MTAGQLESCSCGMMIIEWWFPSDYDSAVGGIGMGGKKAMERDIFLSLPT